MSTIPLAGGGVELFCAAQIIVAWVWQCVRLDIGVTAGAPVAVSQKIRYAAAIGSIFPSRRFLLRCNTTLIHRVVVQGCLWEIKPLTLCPLMTQSGHNPLVKIIDFAV